MTTLTCTHHWIIESPDGQQELKGVCRKCKAVRMFPSWPEEINGSYNKDPGMSQRQVSYRWMNEK